MNIKLVTKLIFILVLMGTSACELSDETPDATATVTVQRTITPNPAPGLTATYTFTPTPINFRTPTPTQTAVTPTPNVFTGRPGIYLVHEQNGSFFLRDSAGLEFALGNFPRTSILEPFPDGNMITFKDQGFIYTQDIISSNILITFTPDGPIDNMWAGTWSPDGKYLAYSIIDPPLINDTGIVPQEFPSIYIGDRSTGISSRVTLGETIEASPTWSPDNQWIAFLSDAANPKVKTTSNNGRYGNTDIYIMPTRCLLNVDVCKGSFVKQLTRVGSGRNADTISWSPDSTKIGFVQTDEQTKDKDICIVSVDGAVSNLTNTPSQSEDEFGWSPDGEQMVFRRQNPARGTDLFILTISDSAELQITQSPSLTERTALWSPDGKTIAFLEVSDSDSLIYYSLSDAKFHRLAESDGKHRNLLFWLAVFPNIEEEVSLLVSPSVTNLNVRSKPSTASSIVTKLESGDGFTILERPLDMNGYIWWKIRTQDGLEGWVVQLYSWYLPNP